MTPGILQGIEGLLFDIDGVLYVGKTPIPGAADTLRRLRTHKLPFRFLTNTTTKTPAALHRHMTALGLPVEQKEIFTTHEVAAAYLKRLGNPPCHLLVADEALAAYDGIPRSDNDPELIVIGDIGDHWNYAVLNRVFNMVMDGAEMLALHKGRYWLTEAGLQMDIGAFVTGLEYTTGKKATLVGKPSATFFAMGLEDLGLDAGVVAMIGDDIESDIGGAQSAGIKGFLVKTGKYNEDAVARSSVTPDAILGSIAEIQRFL